MGHFLSDGVQLKVPRTWSGALSLWNRTGYSVLGAQCFEFRIRATNEPDPLPNDFVANRTQPYHISRLADDRF